MKLADLDVTRSATLVALLVGAMALGACDARRRDWGSCYHEPCADGEFCNSEHRCVPRPLDAGPLDGREPVDAAAAVEALPADAPFGVDVDVEVSPPEALDAPVDAEADVSIVDASQAVDVVVDVAVDTLVPDAPGTCAVDDDCPTSDLSFCIDGACVACKTSEQCTGGTPICSAVHACVSCAAVAAGCPATTPACEADSGRCVECLADLDCKGTPSTSFCVGGACVGCGSAASDACAKRDPTKTACLATGDCGECARDADCMSIAEPICDTATHACRPCASDNECTGTGPGVCMSEQDGRCASDAETIYVGSAGTAGCSDSGVGSAATPYCTAQVAVSAAKSRGMPLLIVTGPLTGGFTGVSLTRSLTVVGRGAVITPGPGADGISIVSGELTLRRVTIRGSAATSTGIGISAAPTSGNSVTLHLDTCAVTDNPGGGIFLNGAAFTIANTVVARNGPNPTAWGGIQIQNPPVAGPTTFSLVTIRDNQQVGLACSESIAVANGNAGVLATGNAGGIDISSTCGIVSCAAAGPDCGAQSGP
jgi:hypothetical protein